MISGVKITQGLLEQLQGKQAPKHAPQSLIPPAMLQPKGQQAFIQRPSDVEQQTTELIREDAAVRRALEGSRRVGDMLVKAHQQEAQQITQLADELMKKEYIAPTREAPCQREQQACLDCYRNNKTAPTKCAELVQGYSKCAQSAFQVFVSRTQSAAPASAAS